MKKILSLLLVALMIVGMLPISAIHTHAAEVSETMTIAANTGTVSGESISWTSDNLSFTANQNTSSNAIRTTDSDHFRLYVGFSATLTCSAGNITKIVMESTGSSYAIAPTGSDGSVGTVSGTTITIVPTASSNTYTIPTISKQTRIKSITVTYATVDSGECAHTNQEEIEAVDATCTTAGNTAGVKCTDCGEVLEGNETINALGHSNDEGVVTAPTCTEDGYTLYTCTVCDSTKKDHYVDATGHTYVDGVCSVCQTEMPTGLAGKYYIAAIRSSGNYIYMTNDLGTASTQRYQIVDSGLTELPASIETPVDAQVFELIFDAATATYKIKTGDQYLGWTSGNSGILVDEATAIAATIEAAENGAYNIHFTASDAERYLALNSNSSNNYFAWYKQGQAEDLYLIPVVEAEVPPCDVHNYVDGVCTVCGAIDQDWEGEPDTTDPTDPEETDPTEPTSSSATISFADTTQRVSQDANSQVWANGGATVTNNKEKSTSNIIDSSNPVRFYKSSDVIIEFKGMTKIEVTCNTAAYATALLNSISDPNAAVSVDDKVVTIVLTEAVDSFTVTLTSGQVRVDSITVYAEVSDHEHTWSEWVETTAPTCTETGIETSTCTICSETKTQTVAATGHTYTYVDGTMTCACGDSKTISTIAEAKAYTSTSTVYYVKGIVTYVSGKNVYIEDATGGICVYFATADAASGIALGDEIVVWDTMTTYNGLIETTNTTAQEYLKVSSGNALPSQTVTLAALLADTTNEYLGERVVIENVTIGVLGTNNTALTDADGNTINIYKAPTLNAEINENDIVTVTAIVSTYNGYQLAVNSADDVVEVKDGAATVIETVTIADAKAGTVGEYYQVEGTVTYISGRNVYIQDATGGIVVYLAKDAATTKVGDNVKAYGALKLYNGLIELDAVDETNTQFYEILSSGNTVDAQEVTIEGLLADTTNEYLAEKVAINGVYVSYYSYNSSYGNVTYTLNDGNGNTIEIYRVTVASEAECFAPGSYVNVEANVSAYVTDKTAGNGYQLVTTNDKIVVAGDACTHSTTELVNVEAATLTEGGYTGDTMCTVCGYYTERGEDTAALTDVDSWGLTLGGDILVNFKIALAESIKDTAQITVAVADKTYTYAAKDYYADGYVYVSASVAAAQMTDEITVTVINGDDQAEKSGYTIKSYAETVLNGEYDDATKALVTAMLHYGAAAQTFFNYKTDDMANAGLDSAEDNVTIPADAAGEIVVSGSAEGITFYGASLVFENKIAVRFYFNVTGDIADYTFTKDGTKYEPVAKKGMYYIEIAGINPQDLDDAVTVTVGELSVSYSPMNYIVRMAEKYENEDLVALVKALYSYHVAAQAYATANAV